MVSHLLYYQLALLAIIWLFVMLHVTWSEPSLTTSAVPAKPKGKRSAEPRPFAGLTPKPPPQPDRPRAADQGLGPAGGWGSGAGSPPDTAAKPPDGITAPRPPQGHLRPAPVGRRFQRPTTI